MVTDLISRAAAVRALASSNGDYLDALERIEKIPIPADIAQKLGLQPKEG